MCLSFLAQPESGAVAHPRSSPNPGEQVGNGGYVRREPVRDARSIVSMVP